MSLLGLTIFTKKKKKKKNLLGHLCGSVSEVSDTVQHPNEVFMLSK